jgi:hypothetical protein
VLALLGDGGGGGGGGGCGRCLGSWRRWCLLAGWCVLGAEVCDGFVEEGNHVGELALEALELGIFGVFLELGFDYGELGYEDGQSVDGSTSFCA